MMNHKVWYKKAISFALCAVMAVGLLPVRVNAAASFTDVTRETVYAEAYEAIMTCAEMGVVSGVGDNKFAPNNSVATPEMVKMVVNAYFRTEFNAYVAEHEVELSNYFGDRVYWFSNMSYYARAVGLLDGISVEIRDYDAYNQPMTRNDMALLLANAARLKGFTATEAQKAAAQAKILDYASIPSACQDAAKTCYALGLLQGSKGYLNGGSSMSRAEACIVLLRIEKLMDGTLKPIDPSSSSVSTQEPTVKDIQVSSIPWSGYDGSVNGGYTSGTAWIVTDNGFGDGYLNNGKPITEENVTELLHEAEKIWPHGMKWCEGGTENAASGNNFYKDSGSVVSRMLTVQNTGGVINTNTNFACGGYAAMISDYLFGRDSNDFHRVTNFEDVRPGDIIVLRDNKTRYVQHIEVAVSAPGELYGDALISRDGYIFVTDGNNGNKVSWPTMYTMPSNDGNDPNDTWIIFSRYPD